MNDCPDHLRFSVHPLEDTTHMPCVFCERAAVAVITSETQTLPYCVDHAGIAESKVSLEAVLRHTVGRGEVPPGWLVIGRKSGAVAVFNIPPPLADIVRTIVDTVEKGGDVAIVMAAFVEARDRLH